MKTQNLSQQSTATYRTLRLGMVVLGLSFPIILAVGATYWLIKSNGAKKSGLDQKKAQGELSVPEHGIKDMFRELPVQATK